MKKLVADFEKNPTLKNARRLIDYIDRHPMAMTFADTYDYTWIEVAKDMVEEATFTNFDDRGNYIGNVRNENGWTP